MRPGSSTSHTLSCSSHSSSTLDTEEWCQHRGRMAPSYPSYLVSCSLSGSAGIRSLSAASSFLFSSSTR